jgi:hypothetical protein
MNLEKKSFIWVLILASIAHFESSCNAKASAQGPNGIAYGYYQLHKGQEQNYDDKKGFCKKNASLSVQASSLCALAILEKQYRNDDMELFNNKSYWDVLRPNGESKKSGLIRQALKNSSFCTANTL